MTAKGRWLRVLRGAAMVVAAAALLLIGSLFAVVPGERRGTADLSPVSGDELARTLMAMKPPKRARPVVAVVAGSAGTETTDYLVPYGVLKRADVADVFALALRRGAVALKPALTVVPDATVDQFEARYPTGADYVIVPAVDDPTDALMRDFITTQAASGATIVGICDGTLVLANAGLLDGRRATGHWFAIGTVAKQHPTMHWVRDRRYVVDRGVVTSTGVSSSIPVSLALVAAIAGPDRARTVVREIGARGWQVAHDSGAFHLIRDDVWMVLRNTALSLWRRDIVGVRANDGADLIALAFTADSYGRTFRSRSVVLGTVPIRTVEGLQVLPDQYGVTPDLVVGLPKHQPAHALDTAIAGIEARYGASTAAFVRVQLEDRADTTDGWTRDNP